MTIVRSECLRSAMWPSLLVAFGASAILRETLLRDPDVALRISVVSLVVSLLLVCLLVISDRLSFRRSWPVLFLLIVTACVIGDASAESRDLIVMILAAGLALASFLTGVTLRPTPPRSPG